MASDPSEAVASARLLAALADTLLPGDAGWPSGAAVGVQAVLATRLVERGPEALAEVLAALQPDAAAMLAGGEAAIAAVAEWEARDANLFGWVRDAAYYAYYESPVVVQAINAHGHQYQLIPHVAGYRLPRFDAERDTPRHGRGFWTATDAVRRVTPEPQP